MFPARDTISPSVSIIRLSRAAQSMSTCRHSADPEDDASEPHQSHPLSHLTALVRQMHDAALPIAQIAQQQAQRRNPRLAA